LYSSGAFLRALCVSLAYFALKPASSPLYNGPAMISQDLLDMLVCPVCKKPVGLNANGDGLKCGECRRVYPIQDDIPIMLVDAASIKD
jgi:uncharacterized protein